VCLEKREKKMIKNIMVFDTETTGELGSPLIYDLGYRIISPNGEVLKTFNCLIAEIFTNGFVMSQAYYSNKIKMYRDKLKSKQIEMVSYKDAITSMINDARHYKVGIIAAYNIAFDLRALNATLKMTYHEGYKKDIVNKLLNQKNKKVLCIWNLACDTILNSDEYRNFAEVNGYKSEKGNYLTNAEVTYRFISENLEFVEDHTALSDVLIEIEILLHALKFYAPVLDYGAKYCCWQKVQVD
jgi:DNA polymerase III epsilon subunit-like protein